MRTVEGEGGTIDEAIAGALAALGVDRDQVEIDILENANRGILGLGRRRARVRATVRAPFRADLDGTPPPRRDGTSAPERDGARSPSQPQAGAVEPPAGAATFDAPAVVGAVLRLMGLDVRVVTGADKIVIEGPDASAVIGRRGEVIDALEYVVNRMAERAGDGRRVAIDVDGYRARRKASVEGLAHRLAERARRQGKPVTVNALSPGDRRTLYAVLTTERGVSARSVGEGIHRKVMIFPGAGRRGGGTTVG